jgi:hypothetical protein
LQNAAGTRRSRRRGRAPSPLRLGVVIGRWTAGEGGLGCRTGRRLAGVPTRGWMVAHERRHKRHVSRLQRCGRPDRFSFRSGRRPACGD